MVLMAEYVDWTGDLQLGKLIVGDAYTQLEFRRVGDSALVNVVGKHGEVEVQVLY